MATLRSNIALLKINGNTWRENLFFLTIRFFGPRTAPGPVAADRKSVIYHIIHEKIYANIY
ncbi:MAG: hypothetical protein GDA48_20825 [Hormoscilla sp. GM102CHS1]|nr:hypothetical protein [Hormoscilla sp. GM102CHS1]